MLRSPCEEWQGARDKDGYGRLKSGDKVFQAHRLIYMQNHGHTDLLILHDCDNPSCINMDHLRAGTYQDNVNDKMQRGRHNNGQAARTHCKHGHEYTDENTRVDHDGRKCRKCGSISAMRHYYKNKKKVSA